MRKAIAVALVALTLMACSSDSKSSSSSGSAASDPKHNDADQAAAEAALLTVQDLPSGFAVKPEPASSDQSVNSDASSSAAAKARDCYKSATGHDPESLDSERTAKANETFTSGEAATTVELYAEVATFVSEDQVSARMADLANAGVATCLEQALSDSLATSGGTVSDLHSKPTEITGVGDASAGVAISATLTTGGQVLHVGFEVNYVQVGRSVVTVNLTSFSGAPDHSLAEQAAIVMVERLSGDGGAASGSGS